MITVLPYDFAADLAIQCDDYTRNGKAPDAGRDTCRTCLFEGSCVYVEIMQLVNAVRGCVPLYMKPTPTGKIVLDFLRKCEDRLFQLISECNEKTSKKVVESYMDAAKEELNPRTQDSPKKASKPKQRGRKKASSLKEKKMDTEGSRHQSRRLPIKQIEKCSYSQPRTQEV